jgi:hypothetical protein
VIEAAILFVGPLTTAEVTAGEVHLVITRCAVNS